MKYTIDAKKKKLGRVASEAASLLMGKNRSDYARNKTPSDVAVLIINASHADIDAKKKSEKIYTSYSGYPGGLKHKKMEIVVAEKGYKEIFRRAVYGMLPSNKLRSRMIKRLVIKE